MRPPAPTVCPTPRTWPAVQDLTDGELNLAIAEHVCGWVPLPVTDHARTGCTHWAPDGGMHLVPDYTGSWDALMPVWFREGMSNQKIHLTWLDDPRGVYLNWRCTDETMLRRAIAEEVLWQAVRHRAAGMP